MNHSNQQDHLRLIAMPHVLSAEKGRIDVQRPAGGSVKDLMRSIGWVPEGLNARVFIDGQYIRDAVWEQTITQPGQSVIVRAIPMGGGGEGQGKDVVRIVAMVAILGAAIAISGGALAPLAGALAGAGGWAAMVGGSTAALIAGAATSILGTLALSSLIPQPLPRRALPQPLDDHRQVAA